MPATAWVRALPNAYADATRGEMSAANGAIDVDLARAQHAAVVDGLAWLGFEIRWIPPAHELPDSVFVEDPAVLVGRHALITHSAHPVRGLEAASVRATLLEDGFEIHDMPRGATLDGGDVLWIGERLFVSPSARTNGAGIAILADTFPKQDLVLVPLPKGVLHLKCACSTPAEDTVVVARSSVDPAHFKRLRVLEVPYDELYAANTVGRAGRVLVAKGYPATRAVLESAGLEVRVLDLSEIARGDGSITCLSLRSEHPFRQ